MKIDRPSLLMWVFYFSAWWVLLAIMNRCFELHHVEELKNKEAIEKINEHAKICPYV